MRAENLGIGGFPRTRGDRPSAGLFMLLRVEGSPAPAGIGPAY